MVSLPGPLTVAWKAHGEAVRHCFVLEEFGASAGVMLAVFGMTPMESSGCTCFCCFFFSFWCVRVCFQGTNEILILSKQQWGVVFVVVLSVCFREAKG